MRSSTLIFGLGQVVAAQNYKLLDNYTPANFFSKFDFKTFPSGDGTGGFVDYKDKATAESTNLIKNTGHSVVFRADNTTVLDTNGPGRPSVRLEGNAKYNKGIIVADIQHMPGAACGSWPAFWSFGDEWPIDGEIDIVEGVNSMSQNKMSLHAGNKACAVQDAGNDDIGVPSGQALDCQTINADTNSFDNPVGCGIDAPTTLPNTFGNGFNDVNGGYYVTQWTESFVKVWFFARSSKPDTLDCDVPDVTLLGRPLAWFRGCDIGQRFANQHLVFSTNFCGSWAGADGVYNQEYSGSLNCPNYGLATPDLSCRRKVAEDPSAYTNQYWEVNGIKVYEETLTAGTGVCHASSSASSSIASSTSSVRPSSSSVAISASGVVSSSVHPSSSSAAISASNSISIRASSVAPSSNGGVVSSGIPTSSHAGSNGGAVISSAPVSHGGNNNGAASSAAPSSWGGWGGNSSVSMSSKTYGGDDNVSEPKRTSSKAYVSDHHDDSYGAKPTSSKTSVPGYNGAKPTSSKAYGGAKPTSSKAYGGAQPTVSKGYSSGDDYDYGSAPNKHNEIPAGCSPIKVAYTTKFTTTIVDVCPTGLTTKTVTTDLPYCAMCHERPTSPYNGFVEEVKVCSKGCAQSAVPITVTVPYDGAYNGVKPTAAPEVSKSYDAKPVVKSSATVEPSWSKPSAGADSKPSPGSGANPAAGADAKPVNGAYTPKPYTPSTSVSTTKTYQPVLATTNGASTTFANAFVMAAAAFAAVMML